LRRARPRLCAAAGGAALALAAGAFALSAAGAFALAAAAGEPEEARPALPSPRAWKSLLLDAERAGARVVAVGERGHVVLSDDGGRSWRQARSVPVRVTLTGVCFVGASEG
jgi:photosystem II stability/assembly factor-like uncharacterized protein